MAAPRVDGKRLERVEAHRKNLLLRFAGWLGAAEAPDDAGRWLVLARDAPVCGSLG